MSVRVASQSLCLGIHRCNLYGPVSSLDLDLKAKIWLRVSSCTSVNFKFTFSPNKLFANSIISSIPCKIDQPFCVGDEV